MARGHKREPMSPIRLNRGFATLWALCQTGAKLLFWEAESGAVSGWLRPSS